MCVWKSDNATNNSKVQKTTKIRSDDDDENILLEGSKSVVTVKIMCKSITLLLIKKIVQFCQFDRFRSL